MNHQQYEQWLLSEEPLSRDQAEALRSHLNTCEACQRLSTAWSNVRQLIQSAPLVEPKSGFVARWQRRIEVQIAMERQALHRRQSWAVFIITALGAITLFALFVTQLSSIFSSPSQFLVYWLGHMSALISTANAAKELVDVLIGSIARVIPLSFWITLLAGFGVLFLFWILSLQLIYFRGGLLNESEN
jgi:predicted anti-sigma-YlaC factor YlaD